MKEPAPVVEEQGVTALLYELKTPDVGSPKRSKDLVFKNMEKPGEVLDKEFVLDSGTSGLSKYLTMLKLGNRIERAKWKTLVGNLDEKKSVLLTGNEKAYNATTKTAALLFRERNAFKQLKQLCKLLEIELPSHTAEYNPGELWA